MPRAGISLRIVVRIHAWDTGINGSEVIRHHTTHAYGSIGVLFCQVCCLGQILFQIKQVVVPGFPKLHQFVIPLIKGGNRMASFG